ncbi:MAG: HAMP domain-containing sensor histidine kinase [Dermatophilaceae bacterium]
MRIRLGLRSRILALTMPIMVAVSAAIVAVVFVSVSDVLEERAGELARAEAREIAAEMARAPLDRVLDTHASPDGDEVIQVVEIATGRVVGTSHPQVRGVLGGTTIVPIGSVRTHRVQEIAGADPVGPYVVAAAGAESSGGSTYLVLVGVGTRTGSSALGKAFELGALGAAALVLLAAAITTFAVGHALRPVERMRHQVEAVADSGPGEPLEVPPGGDELSRLAETMNRMLGLLRQVDTSRRKFVADAGHELRSPLTTIRVLVERMGEERPADERADLADRATAEVDRLAVLVDDLLTLSSADGNAMELAREDVDLDDIVLAEAGVLRARGMPLTVVVEPVRVFADPPKIVRVVRNLLENADRHLVRGARVRVGHRAGQALLIVDNDGPPVPVEDRDRVFERFVRLDDSRTRTTGGTGLGLAIVAELVAAHDGTAVAGEAPDGWCRFEVSLPRGPAPG